MSVPAPACTKGCHCNLESRGWRRLDSRCPRRRRPGGGNPRLPTLTSESCDDPLVAHEGAVDRTSLGDLDEALALLVAERPGETYDPLDPLDPAPRPRIVAAVVCMNPVVCVN